MKKLSTLLIIILISCFGCKQPDNKTIQVIIDKNIETLFILYPLVDIGMPPINYSLCEFARQEFEEFKQHDAVRLLDTLITRTGIDRPVMLIHHFSQLPDIKQIYPIDSNLLKSFSSNNNAIDGQSIVHEFIEAFSDFYNYAKVQSFLNKYQDYYQKSLADVYKNLPPDDFINIMEKYYGKENKAYYLNPSPVLYPDWGFGSRIETEDGLIIFNTFGAVDYLEGDNLEIKYSFNNSEEIRDLSVHEFGHSFINPVTELDEVRKLIENYSYLFKPIEDYMSNIAYREWWTCVTEHLVRLGEIRIAYAMNDSLTADKIRKQNIEENKFIYLPYLENTIVEYEKNRDIFNTIDVFIPKLIRDTFSQIDTSKIKI